MHSKWVPYQNLGISNSERKILSSMGSSARRHGRARPRRPGGARPRRHGGARPRRPGGARPRRHGGARLGPAPAAHRALELAARRPASAMSPPAQPGGVAAAGPWRRRREKRRGRRGRRRRPALGDDPSPASRRNRRRGGRVAGEWAGRGKKGKEGSSAAPSRRGARRCRRSAASRRRPWLLLPLLQGRRPGPRAPCGRPACSRRRAGPRGSSRTAAFLRAGGEEREVGIFASCLARYPKWVSRLGSLLENDFGWQIHCT